MVCEVKVNSIRFLQNNGAIDDIRTITNLNRFEELNDKLTRVAIEKYGLNTGGQQLFAVNTSELTDRKGSRYWRDNKIDIKRAIPNDRLFDELQALKNIKDNRPEAPMFMKTPDVDFSLKIVGALDKINRNKFESSKLQGWLNDLQKQGVSAQQLELFKEVAKPGMTKEEIAAAITATYSYTVEINIAKEVKPIGSDGEYFDENGQQISKKEFENLSKDRPTQYYSNLTVPGGTNYIENELATPAIIPSIKGHAQFATDKGIGWFRSDDKVEAISKQVSKSKVNFKESEDRVEKRGDKWVAINNTIGVLDTFNTKEEALSFLGLDVSEKIKVSDVKTRRILEFQSDLFQKGRESELLVNTLNRDRKDNVRILQLENISYDRNLTKEEEQELRKLNEPNFNKEGNQFLQLLNKNNNWVTFFIKSIVQDSAKKGYEKVLFPSGNTASKVEGHTTLEEFKKQKQDRIKELEKENQELKNKKLDLEVEKAYASLFEPITQEQFDKANKNQIESNNREINQLKQELERVEGPEGFGALRPIFNFYETTVANILKKQGYNPKQVTDEYGNTWNEISIESTRDLGTIMMMRPDALVDVQGIPMVNIDLGTINNARSKEIGNVLGQRLSQSMQQGFQNITEAEARELLKARKIPYNGEPAFYFAGTVYVVGDNINIDTVLHEFSHPLLQGIRRSNPKLFNNLYNLLKGTTEGEQIIELVKQRYPELEEESDLFKEEALAWSLQRKASNKVTQQVETEGFDNYIKKILAAIKQFLRNVFGDKVNVAKLDVNTTLDELADMLLEKDFQFETPKVTEEDIIMYGKFMLSAAERATELTKVSSSKSLEQLIKEVYTRNLELLNTARKFKSDKVIGNMMKESLFRKGTSEYLPGIQRTLRDYLEDLSKPNVNELIENAINAEERRIKEDNARATALVTSLDTINTTVDNILKDLRKIENLPNLNSRSVIGLLGLYKSLASAWYENIKDIDAILSEEVDVDVNNPFYQTINEIAYNITRVQARIGNLYKKNNVQFVVEITSYMNEFVTKRLNENLGKALKGAIPENQLEDTLNEVYNKVINQSFTDDDAAELVKKGVPKHILDKFLKEYKDFFVTPEEIRKHLSGEARDVTFFNRWLESYSSSNDIIVGPVAMFIQDQKTEVENKVWKDSMEFRRKLQDLLPRVGFSKLNTTQVRDLVSEEDTIMYFDKETGKPVEKKVRTFLNEFGNGWRYQQDILEYNLAMAKESKDQEAISKAQAELRQFNRDYMYDEYVPEYYEKDEIFNRSEVGGLAYLARREALNEYNNLVNQFDNELERLENYSSIQAAWRKYTQLSELYYEDGTPKVDDPENGIYDLSIAKVLLEYKEATKDFSEFVPIEGSLQTSYNEVVALLESQGITKGSGEFKRKIREWERQNLRIVNTEEFYEERAAAIEKIIRLQAKMNSVMNTQFNVGDAYKKISELIFAYKDEQGQPISTALSEDRLKMIKDTEQQIIDFKFNFDIKTGLTKDQAGELEILAEIAKKRPDDMTPEQESRYVYLINLQNNAGINPQDALDLQDAFKELSNLQTRIPTEYYMEALNYNLSKQNVKELNEDEVDDFINSDEFQLLLDADENFKKWFNLNHITKKVFNKKLNDYEEVYDKTRANTVAVPRNSKYIKTTKIIDTETNQEITLMGVPNIRHSRYQVKNKYRTIPFGEDKSQYVGKYIDNKGNYLPRPFNPNDKNSAKDARFINKEYLKLKAENSPRFQLLEAMKEYSLSQQEGMSNYGKLYLDLPRYAIKRMDIYQVMQKGKYGERFKELGSNIKEWLKQSVGKSAVDFENDLNYDPKNNLVNTNLQGDRVSYIPVTGIYNLDLDITDADVLNGLFRYAMSIQSQGKLYESLPLVEGLLDTLEDPANKPKNLDKFQKGMFNLRNKLQNVNKEGATNNRLGQLRSLIEREYYGKRVVGMEENHPRISKWLQTIQGLSARGSLAVNIPSDLKNKYSGYVQTLIEAAGGEFITLKDLALATPWATKTMLEWTSKGIYAVGPGPLSTQIVEIFDPAFKTKDEFGRSVTRSLFKDLVNGEWMYMHRKFGEMEVAMKLFGSFMYGQKVDQMLSDGKVKSIRYIDAWEKDPETGIARLKKGIHPAWSNLSVFHTYIKGETLEEIAKKYYITKEELMAKNKIKSETQLEDGQEIIIAKSEKFKAFKNQIQGVSRKLFGVYDEFGQPEGNKLMLYRMFMFLRKWFTPMLVNRFGMDTSKENFGNYRYDWALGKYTKGYYVSAFQTLWGLIKSKGQDYKYMSKDQKAALIKTASEALAMIMFTLIVSALFGFDPDDEEKWKKLKAKSGPLFSPTFKTYGWLSNHALNLILGIEAETGAFIPLPSIFGMNLGSDDYIKMLTSTSAAFSNTLVLYTQILGDFFNFITFDEADRYKKETGPYWWQQKGSLKLWGRLFKTIGFTGISGRPETLIENMQESATRIGG